VSDLALEPWLDKRGLAQHLACSVRSVELAVAAGMPHAVIFGRVKFHASEAEAWLEQAGRLRRIRRRLDPADNVGDHQTRPGSAVNTTGPGHEELEVPHVSKEA
jgi:hypothetical protein